MTIAAIVLERPEPEPDFTQHPCLDKCYDNDTGYLACIDHGYTPHIAPIRDERPERPKMHKPRRWVVERTLAWLSKCRGLLVRYDEGGREVPRPPQARLLRRLGPPLPAPHRFEIVTSS